MSKFFKKLLTKKPQKPQKLNEGTESKQSTVREKLFFDRNHTLHNFSELDEEDPKVIGYRSHGNKVLMVLDVKLPVATVKFAFRNVKRPIRKSPSKKKRTVKKSPAKARRSPAKARRYL